MSYQPQKRPEQGHGSFFYTVCLTYAYKKAKSDPWSLIWKPLFCKQTLNRTSQQYCLDQFSLRMKANSFGNTLPV